MTCPPAPRHRMSSGGKILLLVLADERRENKVTPAEYVVRGENIYAEDRAACGAACCKK